MCHQLRFPPGMCVLLILMACCCRGAAAGDSLTNVRNVLLIVSDDLKASSLGCYGNDICETPHLDRLAEQGLLFERAYCQGTWCLPSRQSFMYSKYSGKSRRTLGECLRDQGLYSARVGKIFHMRVPGDIIDGTNGPDVDECWDERFNSPGREAHTPGDYACLNLNVFTDREENRQSTKMPHRMFVTVQYEGDGSDQPDAKSAAKAIELLREHQSEPFFLAVGLVRPHYPMVAPKPYFDRYDLKSISLPEVPENDLDDIPSAGLRGITNGNNAIGRYPENQRRMWQGYYASVTFMDEQVGKILAELDRLGIRDQTAVVFTSDHGYHLGEHTHWQKVNFHEEVIRVPLLVSSPGVSKGRTNSLVELVDLYPTVVSLLGKAVPNDLDGIDLSPVLKNPSASLRQTSLSLNKVKKKWEFSSRGDRYAYMRYGDGSEELYDMSADPKQFTNLVNDKDHRAALLQAREELDDKVKSIQLP